MQDNKSIKGRLIVFEGLDGAGKSTQNFLLKRFLESQKIKVFLSEWNSSPMVKSATRRGKKKRLLTPTTFSLIHSADFTTRYVREIYPLLQAGFVVICDRYVYTAFARDVVRGCDREWVRNLYSFAIKPHISFYCRIPLKTAVRRILSGRTKLKYFEAGMDMGLSDDIEESFGLFQERIFQEYERIVGENDFEIIDASLPINEQQEMARKVVKEKIDLPSFRQRSKR
ncbi:MAG: Thymidylate kinase [Syntrophomonadaceae bacterium]|nr:Thymidylate kinase [Bacillota bacterium]MBT9147504.1 Thymidylate kinase [Bacillota bacterium]